MRKRTYEVSANSNMVLRAHSLHRHKEEMPKTSLKGAEALLSACQDLPVCPIFPSSDRLCPSSHDHIYLHVVGSATSEVGIDLRSNRYINVAWCCLKPCSELRIQCTTSFHLIFKSTVYISCLPTSYQNFSFSLPNPQMLATFLDLWRLSSPQ